MAATDYYQQNLKDIIGGTMPEFKRQRKNQYDFLVQNALRTGQSAASAASAVRPFADAAGTAAAKAGVQAKRMSQQQEQFDTQQGNWQKAFDKQSSQWQSAFDQRNKDQSFANMMNLYQQNQIMTPEMMEAFGYGDVNRSGMQNVQRQMDMLGISGGGGGSTSGPFGQNNQMLLNRAMQPGPGIGSNTAGRRQQAWLQSQFG